MAPTGPFLLPGGQHLGSALKAYDADSVVGAEPSRRKQGKTSKRGKDLQWSQVAFQYAKAAAAAASTPTGHSAQELAELRALEAVGVRRRRRWLNDRILREMAGHMTLADIERQFKPVPFGFRSASALEVIAQPQHAYLWEGFRNIDADREARLLQRWEKHNRQEVEACRPVVVPNAAAQALSRWGRVSKKGRMALRKAKLHTVLALEQEVLEFLELGEHAALRMAGLDSWGRLLLHGIADFWGLNSATTAANTASSGGSSSSGGGSGVLPTCKEESEEEEDEAEVQEVAASPAAAGPSRVQAPAVDVEADGQQDGSEPVITLWHRKQDFAPMPPPDVTLTDVLMAMAETGGSLNAKQLQHYIRTHVHGSEAGRTDEWIIL